MPTSTKNLPLIYSILDSPAYGGAEQYLLSNLRYLSQQGYPVCLATNNIKVKEQCQLVIHEFKLKHFEIIEFPFVLDAIGNWKGLIKFFFWAPFAMAWQAMTFLKFKQKHNQTICYWAGFSDRLLLSAMAKLWGHFLIWIEIGPLEPTFKKNWGFPRFLYMLTKHLPNTFITTSLWTKRSMLTTGKIESHTVHLVYPGVIFPNDSAVKIYKRKGENWKELNVRKEKVVISFIGRMAKENEVEVLLYAVTIAQRKSHPHIFTILIGDGPDKKYYEDLGKSLGISDKLLFTGFVSQEEKLTYVAASDIFVFARAWDLDGFGMTPLEGMSVEIPVITTDFGPQKEIVEDKVNGLRFTPHNSQSLAKKIQELIKDRQLRNKLGKQGRESLTPKFTEQTMHEKTLKVIQQVIKV